MTFMHLETSRHTFLDIIYEVQSGEYGFDRIGFQPGDIILDVGANVGVVSIYLAKLFPFVKIYSFEPVPVSYEHLVQNLVLNGVTNVIPHPLALTCDRRRLKIAMCPQCTGGSTVNSAIKDSPDCVHYWVNSTTLDDVLEDYRIARCRLLKIDCEGSEHEILHQSQLLHRIEYLSAEFHINQNLLHQGYTLEALFEKCLRFIAPDKIKARSIRMCE